MQEYEGRVRRPLIYNARPTECIGAVGTSNSVKHFYSIFTILNEKKKQTYKQKQTQNSKQKPNFKKIIERRLKIFLFWPLHVILIENVFGWVHFPLEKKVDREHPESPPPW